MATGAEEPSSWASLQRRLQSSQEAQHRQAVLVRQLQAKLLRYRTRWRELEQRLEGGGGSLPGRWEATADHILEKTLLQLVEEQQRCENLAEVNALLWQQLENASEVNAALQEDVGKLRADWMRSREELEAKEREWCAERERYDSHFRDDRNCLLDLWRQVVTFRRQFLEMKTATDRDLSEMKAEQMRLSGSVIANCSRLNSSVMCLQAQRDVEKMELQERLKDLVALEEKHSFLQRELVVAREALEESHLHRDLLQREKHELSMALEKAEQSVAELRGAQNALSAELADLRVATANVSSSNEALALDKMRLKKVVLQLERENEALSGEVEELERAKISAQEQLRLCERRNEEVCAEKAQLEQLLKKAEEQQEGLRVELRMVAKEKEEAQEKLTEAHSQLEWASSGLEQLRQESSGQGQALAEVCQEKDLLVREKAALEVRLAATERDRQGLSEQLAEARSVKETLESRLFEAQQRLSQLEMARSHLEMQLHTVTQAREVIQGEVKCLRWELEAERDLLKREREKAARQLLATEQQHKDRLRLQESDHQVEMNKLLQDLASERERHHSELREMLEQWREEKAETEEEHAKTLFEMKEKVATMQAQEEEEGSRVENAKQEVLLEKEREKSAVLERLRQREGELREAYQQVEQLRQEVKEQQEKGQNMTEKLQAELQEAQSAMKAVEKRHKEELKIMREEMQILHQQRDALENQHERYRLQAVKEKRDWELKHLEQTLTKKDEEIGSQRDRVRSLEKTLARREQELRKQSELLKQLTSALRWKGDDETLKNQLQKLRKWEEEEAEKRRVLQEREGLLQRQKELTQQLADEREAKREAVERVIAVLKQTESREMEWKEKAQALTGALSKSEMANGTLREEIAVLQSMVSERDRDRFHLQQPIAEGQQLPWPSEKRLLSERVECLERAVAELDLEKTELKIYNADLRRTLEEVERERRRLKRRCRGRSLPDAGGVSLAEAEQPEMPASSQEDFNTRCRR